MPSRVLESYQPYFGEASKELLSENDAKDFCISVSKLVYTIHNSLKSYLGDNADINMQLLGLSVASAYLDIKCSLNLHEMEGGPSGSKKAAAVACWINRIKPIQISAEAEREGFAYLNAHLSVLVALTILHGEGSGDLNEVIHEDGRWNHLIYVLMWRNPSYKELTTLFEFIK